MIRKLIADDRGLLKIIIEEIDEFSSEEKEIALELIDEALQKPEQDYYNIFVQVENDLITGYHCIGRRPMTDGVYDLYWIVVKPDHQNKGVGKKLLEHVEEYVEEKNGRWILVETSSKDIYSKTRNFYLRNFYTKVAEIKDFYSRGDNLIIFGKYLTT